MANPDPARPLRLDFDTSVAFLLSSLANKLSITASRRLRRRLQVGLMEWRCLVLLAVEGQATPARIAQVAGVDKSVVSRSVSALERRGLVQVCASPTGRQTRVEMTAEGLALHDKGIPDSFERESGLLEGLSESERATLIALLKRLTTNVSGLAEAP